MRSRPLSTAEAARAYFADDARSNHERMLAGDLYLSDDPTIAQRQADAVRAVAHFESAYREDPAGAQELLRDLLGSVGAEAFLRAPLYLDYGSNIHIGARTFVNNGLTTADVAEIRIGDDCQIGPHVQLLTPTHPIDPQQRLDKLEAAEPITIGDNVWLGGGVIVCPGVSIGRDSVVGAGSVVTRDVPAGVVAVGNPARVIRTI